MVDAEQRTKNDRLRYLFQVLSVVALVLLSLYLLAH
jgi:preprotein translocase subunit SecE